MRPDEAAHLPQVTARSLVGIRRVVGAGHCLWPYRCRVCLCLDGGVLVSAELEARVFELELALEGARLDLETAYQKQAQDEQTRERHALQVIADIAGSVASGESVPTLETLRVEFGAWVRRQSWNKSQMSALMAAEDTLDDIIAGRIKPGQVTAQEVISRDA